MGYRAAWMSHAGTVTRHSEAFLHLIDREIRDAPMTVLVIGGIDGCAEVWRAALADGSMVMETSADDAGDRQRLLSVLGSQWFDIVHDRSGSAAKAIAPAWPYLKPGGVLILERTPLPLSLAEGFLDGSSDFPDEEIARVALHAGTVIVEKRNPRVIDYLDVFTGSVDPDGLGEGWMREGAMRVNQTQADAS